MSTRSPASPRCGLRSPASMTRLWTHVAIFSTAWCPGHSRTHSNAPANRGDLVAIGLGEVVCHQDESPLGAHGGSASSVKPVEVSVVLGVREHRLEVCLRFRYSACRCRRGTSSTNSPRSPTFTTARSPSGSRGRPGASARASFGVRRSCYASSTAEPRSGTADGSAQRRPCGSPAAHQSGRSPPCASMYRSVRAAVSQPDALCPQNFQSSRAERL